MRHICTATDVSPHIQGYLAIFYAAFVFIIFVCSSSFAGFILLGEPATECTHRPPTFGYLSTRTHLRSIHYSHIHIYTITACTSYALLD